MNSYKKEFSKSNFRIVVCNMKNILNILFQIHTLICQRNGGYPNKQRRSEKFPNFNKQGVKINGV